MPGAPLHSAKDRRAITILALVLVASFLLKLQNLGDPAITTFDETFHAIVARNLVSHPLTPTLVDRPYLPYDFRDWTANHVWLHKGILPLWQIALSYAVLGVDTFALRLPSAILGTAAVWLTFLIGRELLGRRSALIAATLQAFNPAILMLVHGYWFSDHVDTALIFYVELGIYFLVRAIRTGLWRYALLAGVAQGLAFLCKYFLAGIILGIAVVAWLPPIVRLGRRGRSRLRLIHLGGLILATLVTIAPWMIWCLHQFPNELRQELLHAGRHLGASIEGWGAPWDRVVFDYLIQLYREFYTPILVAVVVLLGRAVSRRHTGLWLTYAWAFGVLVPHLFAESKTPSATAMAIPAFFLLLGFLISEAWRGRRSALAAWTGIMAIGLVYPAVIQAAGEGYPASRAFGAIMRENLWVVWHVVVALAVVVLMAAFGRRRGAARGPAKRDQTATRPSGGTLRRNLRGLCLAFCVVAMAVLGVRTLAISWTIVNGSMDASARHAFPATGEFVRGQLPDNAVLLVEDQFRDEHRVLQFFADRTCYPLSLDEPTQPAGTPNRLQDAHKIAAAGGRPYLATPRRLALPRVFDGSVEGLFIYECPRD